MKNSPRPNVRRLFVVFLLLAIVFSLQPIQPSRALTQPNGVDSTETCSLNPTLITWAPAEFECPICQTKNIFLQWASYGNYIYQFPSKYQLVFWPYTASQAWYSCRKCRYTAFMGDFKEIPKEKIPEIRKVLETVDLPAQVVKSDKETMERPPYLAISTSARLLAAEKVYRALGLADDSFWDHFYRVLGYHFHNEKNMAQADEARKKSLMLIQRMLEDKTNDWRRKELLFLSGSMHHFLRDDQAATKELEAAQKLPYTNPKFNDEQNKNFNDYMSRLIKDYLELLHKGAGPRTLSAVD